MSLSAPSSTSTRPRPCTRTHTHTHTCIHTHSHTHARTHTERHKHTKHKHTKHMPQSIFSINKPYSLYLHFPQLALFLVTGSPDSTRLIDSHVLLRLFSSLLKCSCLWAQGTAPPAQTQLRSACTGWLRSAAGARCGGTWLGLCEGVSAGRERERERE